MCTARFEQTNGSQCRLFDRFHNCLEVPFRRFCDDIIENRKAGFLRRFWQCRPNEMFAFRNDFLNLHHRLQSADQIRPLSLIAEVIRMHLDSQLAGQELNRRGFTHTRVAHHQDAFLVSQSASHPLEHSQVNRSQGEGALVVRRRRPTQQSSSSNRNRGLVGRVSGTGISGDGSTHQRRFDGVDELLSSFGEWRMIRKDIDQFETDSGLLEISHIHCLGSHLDGRQQSLDSSHRSKQIV